MPPRNTRAGFTTAYTLIKRFLNPKTRKEVNGRAEYINLLADDDSE
jgi:hypothetical protein